MMIRINSGPRVRVATKLLLGGVLAGAVACSDLLEVKNPNAVLEDALTNPAAAGPMANGVLAAGVRMLSATTVPYAVATDELDWIGSRDAWLELERGHLGNYLNEFTDQPFPYLGEARYLANVTINRLVGFDQSGQLTNRSNLARTYLYAAIIYASIADMYDDFAFSTKTNPAAPIGRANMISLYDSAIVYLDRGLAIANAGTTADFTSLRYPITAYRARVKHGRAVWQKITPQGTTAPTQPLVNDAGANADAAAAIALGTGDQKFNINSNIEAQPTIALWFEVNGRNEHRTGSVYRTLVDPVSGNLDATAQTLLAQFTAYGSQSGVFTLTSTRELRLILAEAALQSGNLVEFTTQINAVRALDSKPAWAGTPSALDILKHERQAQLWLMRRRLADMYRFGIKETRWTVNPNADIDDALRYTGLLFPIPNVERLGNPCIDNPGACSS